ncbi:hypothetical protein DYB32_007844 [Aphanomyces invadans]|uniref:Uncharacterized protein n=1 Tax=Aphanomyces invadans TaxID=157072 RepID=A0A3R6YZZ3_9STRA|nr:hypothetical protein DYB32_007844 [Aphanomyces invadans]
MTGHEDASVMESFRRNVLEKPEKFAKNPTSVAFFAGETSDDATGAGNSESEGDIAEEQDNDMSEGEEEDSEPNDRDDRDDDEEEDEDGLDDEDELTSAPTKSSTGSKKRKRRDLEDGFFDWDEMEKAAEEGDDGDDNEFDEEVAEEEDEKPSSKRKAATLLTDEQEEELAERGILSTHQRRSNHLHDQIKSLEEEALGDKPWVLKGEVKASARPENSLLEATLEYDRPTKVAPIITVEVTQELEELIKSRIRDDNFNDVVRKLAVNENAQKEATELSMEKSKEGLGEIYEKEYMKTAMGFEDNSELKKEQEEIDVMFQKLCWKLDALTNFHFTPKPIVREMHVTPAAPAITMEEAVPIAVSDANLHAPEEVYDKKHKRDGVVRSREEMSQDERKAARNAKKHARRKSRKQKEADEKLVAKVNPGMGNKYEKKKLLDSLQAKNVSTGKAIEGSTRQFSNSSEFFSRLQDEQKAAAAGQAPRSSHKKNDPKAGRGAAFYKL